MPSNLSGRLSSTFGRIDRLWAACALLAAVMVFTGSRLPLWHLDMRAPQYPQGLTLTAYGDRMEGDLTEVNALNHYVGIGAINPDEVFELQLFPYAVAALVTALVLGSVLARHRLLRLGLMLGVWSMAIGFVVDLQIWLYRTGHDVRPDAPIRPGEFTPKVIGTTEVLNFHNEAMVVDGFWLLLGAALVVSFGPAVIRFLIASWRNTGAVQSPSGDPETNATPGQSAA
ncbi:MAG: cytochrome C [Dehalococcoidia bacterium]|nr:MAG: cytochrome C [Dehalococcoidia bacterium]